MTLATGYLSHAFPSSLMLLAGSPAPRNTVTGYIPQSSCWGWGGSLVEALQIYSNTQSHWSSGSTLCFPLMGAEVHTWFTLTMELGSPVITVSLQNRNCVQLHFVIYIL